jgi:hypothetical protein
MQSPDQAGGIPLPAKVIVSLRAGAILAVANVICAAIIAFAFVRAKAEPKVINVTGSAKKAIQSDLIVWTIDLSTGNADLSKAYDQLKVSADKTLAHLKAQSIRDAEVKVSSIRTSKHFVKNEKNQDTDKISEYWLNQSVEVVSPEVAKIREVERGITVLLKDGVLLESPAPKFLYTHLADLKITMLAEATRDATARAQQIAGNSGATLGAIRDARMGVMQINPAFADEVSGSGVNDTSSFQKEITAVVSAKFELK